MLAALLTGFFLGISLIVAIGAQNVYVLRQGMLGNHTFYVALFCAVSDSLLICIGVVSISFFLNNFFNQISNVLFGISAIWLIGYALLKLKAAFKGTSMPDIKASSSKTLFSSIGVLSVLTFLNPHVYLDTMVLIGAISQQFTGADKVAYAFGASLASFIFFFSLGYGAKFLASKMKASYYWQILDLSVAIVMLIIAIKLAYAGNWI
jgi:L-lysine exporter family protein LysE/ArgO